MRKGSEVLEANNIRILFPSRLEMSSNGNPPS